MSVRYGQASQKPECRQNRGGDNRLQYDASLGFLRTSAQERRAPCASAGCLKQHRCQPGGPANDVPPDPGSAEAIDMAVVLTLPMLDILAPALQALRSWPNRALFDVELFLRFSHFFDTTTENDARRARMRFAFDGHVLDDSRREYGDRSNIPFFARFAGVCGSRRCGPRKRAVRSAHVPLWRS